MLPPHRLVDALKSFRASFDRIAAPSHRELGAVTKLVLDRVATSASAVRSTSASMGLSGSASDM